MSKISKFEYEGNLISFEFSDGNRMINAAEMVKSFPSKRINNDTEVSIYVGGAHNPCDINKMEFQKIGEDIYKVDCVVF